MPTAPRHVADELVRPEADRILLEAVVADLLEVLLRHDPAGAGDDTGVVVHEVGPRLVEREADTVAADDADVLDLLVQQLALRALEAELHVVAGERIAIVKRQSLAQLELVRALIRRDRPGLGEARSLQVSGQRLDQRVVQRIEDPERRELSDRLAWIEPLRGDGDVHGPAHLAVRLRLGVGVFGVSAGDGDA